MGFWGCKGVLVGYWGVSDTQGRLGVKGVSGGRRGVFGGRHKVFGGEQMYLGVKRVVECTMGYLRCKWSVCGRTVVFNTG